MSENPEVIIRGRLDGRKRNRLKSLLDMMYRPSELAKEIGISIKRVYDVYVPLGCPHERDRLNHIWINGRLFREWYIENYKKVKLKAGQAFCMTCKKAVKMHNPELKETRDGLVYYLCECPYCRRRLTRIVDQKWIDDDRSGKLEVN